MTNAIDALEKAHPGVPLHYVYALQELGVQEHAGTAANPRIIEYHKCTTLKATSDEVAWCSSFACFVVERSGKRSVRSAAARDWYERYHASPDLVQVDRLGVRMGDIVVFDRADENNSRAAHVTLFTAASASGKWLCLGGNQNNRVWLDEYDPKKLVGIVRVV